MYRVWWTVHTYITDHTIQTSTFHLLSQSFQKLTSSLVCPQNKNMDWSVVYFRNSTSRYKSFLLRFCKAKVNPVKFFCEKKLIFSQNEIYLTIGLMSCVIKTWTNWNIFALLESSQG